MEKVAWTIVVVLLGAIGAYLVVGYGDDGRDRGWLRSHLEVMDEQLSSLEVHLRRFKESHGRYPSTDEGLSVLDSFAARMKITLFKLPSRHGTDDPYGFDTRGYITYFSDLWSTVRERLRDYRFKHGHVPRTLAEMNEAGIGWCLEDRSTAVEGQVPLPKGEKLETVERELAIGHDDVLFLIGPAGVLTPWQMPYVYENRRDTDTALFADSPVDSYRAGRYSVKIDEGGYLWSVGAKSYSEEYYGLWLGDVIIRCIGAGMILVAVGLIWWNIRGRARIPVVVGLILSAVAGVKCDSAVYMSCCIMTATFSNRDPAMVSRRMELLDKYRVAGAISDETYDKSLESMGLKPDQQPATRPNESE